MSNEAGWENKEEIWGYFLPGSIPWKPYEEICQDFGKGNYVRGFYLGYNKTKWNLEAGNWIENI